MQIGRRRVILSVSFITMLMVVVALVLYVRYTNTDADRQTEPAPYVGYAAELSIGTTAEVLIELGRVTPSSTTITNIRLTNCTDTPIALTDYRATCRCVWLDMPKSAIGVGEHADITLYFDSRGEWGSIGNYVSITTSNQECEVAIWLSAEVE